MRGEYADALRAELLRAGVTDFEFQHGGKHPRVVYMHEGQRRMFVFPASPSDGRHGLRNAVADFRRHLGIAAPKQSRSRRIAKPRKAQDAISTTPDSFTVKPNPLLVLRAWKPASRFAWIKTEGPTWRVEVLR